MKKSKEFDNILDECLERLLVKGETVEQCLQSYPEQAGELEPLLLTALAAKQASAIQPNPEFKTRARYQFRSAIRQVESGRSRSFFAWQPRWATVLVIVLVLLLAGSGTVMAADNSMPDEPLYSTKLAVEQIRLTLARSNLSKAELYAKFANKRVLEIARMAEEGKPVLVERVTRRLDAQLAMIVSLVASQPPAPEVMLAPAPRAAEPPAKAPGPPAEAGGRPAPTKQDARRAKLRAAIALYAMKHPAELEAILSNTPESARPALRRAIIISIARYAEALDAIGE